MKYLFSIYLILGLLTSSCTNNSKSRKPTGSNGSDTTNKTTRDVNDAQKFQKEASSISKQLFDSLYDFTICNILESSVKRVKIDSVTQEFSKKCDCYKIPTEDDLYERFIKKYSVPDYKFKGLFDELRDKRKETGKNLNKDSVIEFLTEKIFSDTMPKSEMANFVKNRSADEKEMKRFKGNLKEELSNLIITSHKANSPNPTADKQTHVSKSSSDSLILNIQGNIHKLKNKLNSQENWLWVLTMLTATGIIYGIYLSRRINKIKFGTSSKNTPSTGLNSEYVMGMLDTINKRLNKLEFKPEELAQQGKVQLPEKQLQSVEIPPNITIDSESTVDDKTFYSSAPETNGVFKLSNTTPNERKGASIFVFRKTKDRFAEFSIIQSEDAVKLAKNSYNQVIPISCIEESAYDPNATHIATIKPGEVELRGDIWNIIRKATIKYE